MKSEIKNIDLGIDLVNKKITYILNEKLNQERIDYNFLDNMIKTEKINKDIIETKKSLSHFKENIYYKEINDNNVCLYALTDCKGVKYFIKFNQITQEEFDLKTSIEIFFETIAIRRKYSQLPTFKKAGLQKP